MNRWKLLASALIGGLAVVLVIGLSVDAQTRTVNPEGAKGVMPHAQDGFRRTMASSALVTSAFSYQGVLKESDEPVSGDREMVFGLYANEACTTGVGNRITHTVPVSDGLFDIDLSFNQAHFNGQALWLRTEVEGTVIGCQTIQAVPYANGVRPGTVISGPVSAEGNLVHARSGTRSADEGVLGAKLGYRSSLGYPVGLYAYAYEFGSVGVWGVSDSEFGWGINGIAQGPGSIGVRGIAAAITSTTYGVYGESSSADGSAGYFENTATSDEGWALTAQGRHGALITSTGGSALVAHGSGDSSIGDDGVQGVHTGDGVVGESEGTENLDNGVVGFSAGGYGVYGFSNTAGQYGGYFDDPISVNGGCTGCTIRYVARNTSDNALLMGDIVQTAGVEAELASAQQPVIKVAPAESGDRVLGVVVGRTERTVAEPGANDVQPGAHYGPVGGPAAPGDYLVIVVQGMAQVRLDPSAGIGMGDGITAGVDGVTKAVDTASFGMVLDEMNSDGLAWVLVGLE